MKTSKIFITQSAEQKIIQEAELFKSKNIECSGSLIGFSIGNKQNLTIITHALKTGFKAKQQTAHVLTDSAYQSDLLYMIKDHYNNSAYELQYLGDYHLHPFFMPELSPTDIKTIYEILNSEIAVKLPALTIILVTFHNSTMVIKAYQAKNHILKYTKIKEIPYEIIPDDDYFITSMLNSKLLDIAKYERMENDLFHIKDIDDKAHWVILDKNTLGINFKFQEIAFNLIYPAEYPFNPPLITYEEKDDIHYFNTQFQWNSQASVIELVQEAIKSIENKKGAKDEINSVKTSN